MKKIEYKTPTTKIEFYECESVICTSPTTNNTGGDFGEDIGDTKEAAREFSSEWEWDEEE